MNNFSLEDRIVFSSLGFEWKSSAFHCPLGVINRNTHYVLEREGECFSYKSRSALLKSLNLPSKIKSKKLKVCPGVSERGVFANEEIKRGEVVEVCPVVLLPVSKFKSPEEVEIRDKQLMRYQFAWNASCDALALGMGSLYNHSSTPNAYFKRVYENDTLSFIALKDIGKYEEILIDYQYNPLNEVALEVNEFLQAVKSL